LSLYKSTEPASGRGEQLRLDISKEEEVNGFFQDYKDKLNNLILINAAGISYNSLAHKADISLWKEVIDTNLVGLFNLVRLVLPIMRNDNYGRIINLSSVVAQQGVAGTTAYAASKAALWGLCRSLAVENGNKGITANNINLGYFDIGMIEQVPEKIKDDIIKKIPVKRLGTPEEIFFTVEYIIDTAYLNGTSIDLNGGLY
jgi:acetoacetyl-CoA reductase/3-oxoacyl-[acyl-carrier protein] reductase